MMHIMNLKTQIKRILFSNISSMIYVVHHVSDCPELPRSGCLLSTEGFIKLLDYTPKFVKAQDALGNPCSRRAVLTFDDGLEDLYTIAYPILQERQIPFTCFIVTDFLDQPGYLTTAQLQEMANDHLVTIGSHGVTHHIFSGLSKPEKTNEFNQSKAILEKITGKPVPFFAYSHGSYDDETLTLAEQYQYAFTVDSTPLNWYTGRNKKALPRYNVENDTLESVIQDAKRYLKNEN